jgi:antagonist of KipI
MSVTVVRMTGLATVQDAGRTGFRAEGVPQCGVMDAAALALANELVGNAGGEAAIEWALAGGALRFDSPAVVAVTGAEVELTCNGAFVANNLALELNAGDELAIGGFVRGAYAYVAVSGGIAVPAVLGSRSTYLPAGFGGLGGRRLRAADVLPLGAAAAGKRRAPTALPKLAERGVIRTVRAVEGPNAEAFTREFRATFWGDELTLSANSNRTGYRLERAAQQDHAARSAPSEPACVGAIQVPDGNGAIVLMADGPTVGGYPKIGVVAAVYIPILAQCVPGDRVRFEPITVDEAQRLLRTSRSLAGPEARA